MKRVFFGISVLLVLLVSVGSLFAGGEAEGAGNTLTVWCWDPSFNGYAMQEAGAAYAAENPDAVIEIVDVADGIEGKIEAGLQAGGAGLPDIVLLQDFVVERFLQNYPGAFVDLKAQGINYDNFAPYKLGPMSEGDKVYGMPFDSGSTGLFLRADMLREAGFTPEDYQREMTWREVITLAEGVKAAIGKPLFAYDNTVFDFLRIMVQSTGEQFFDPDGTVRYDSPAVRRSLSYLKEMSEKGLILNAEGWNNWVAAFNSGDTAGFINGVWIVGTLKSQPENTGKWMAIPTPRLDGIPGARNASNNGGSSWYLLSSSKNQDLALDFLSKTWASTSERALEFYNTILGGAGAMGTFLPSRSGSNYTAADPFFYNEQAVYGDFARWMEEVPTLTYTPNYVSMRTALNNAMANMFAGNLQTVDEVIAAAQAEYDQIVGN